MLRRGCCRRAALRAAGPYDQRNVEQKALAASRVWSRPVRAVVQSRAAKRLSARAKWAVVHVHVGRYWCGDLLRRRGFWGQGFTGACIFCGRPDTVCHRV